MKQQRGLAAVLGVAALLAAPPPAAAHSWVEQLMRIASNGTMTGAPGYIRGYVSRSVAGFSDDMDDYLLPPNGRSTGNAVLATDNLCHPSQTPGNYSAAFPPLSAAAGDYIALRYQENGHVTLPQVNPTKPLNRGTVYIYGTDQPAAGEKFADVFQRWTADGTGGDGRGRLLATRNFDDGQCYQINSGAISTARQAQFKKVAANPQGADLWCQNDIQLPADLAAGSNYTLYWIWSWPTFNQPGSPTDIPSPGYNITLLQYYTSCMDVSVLASGSSSKAVSGGGPAGTHNYAASFVRGQDLNYAAVLSELEAGAFQVSVPGGSNSSSSSGSSSSGGSPTGSSSSSSSHTGGSGDRTVVITVTQTEAPVYVTVTVPAGGGASPSASTTTSSSSSGPATTRHSTRTTFVTSTSTRTETVASGSSAPASAASRGGQPASEPSSSSAASPTSSSTTAHITPTPGQTLTVYPFLSSSSSGSIASSYSNTTTSASGYRFRRARRT